ncbi:hypothetical protein Tco_0732726 [Tanacetum coccineum]
MSITGCAWESAFGEEMPMTVGIDPRKYGKRSSDQAEDASGQGVRYGVASALTLEGNSVDGLKLLVWGRSPLKSMVMARSMV